MFSMDGTVAIYSTAVLIGMLHGVEPGHGWPVAAVFALRRHHRWWYGIGAAVILAVAHLTSSFAVVAAYALADHFFELQAFRWIHLVAGGLLLIMAAYQWRGAGHHHHHHHDEHPHHHRDSPERLAAGSLWGLAGFAFALGFVHEEEFAIIALAAGKANPWLVMGIYASAVGVSLILLTTAAVATFNRFEQQLERYQNYLPRFSAVVLGAMGLAYVFRVL
jgi:ABC-type nickel/cobalt efflux system permease component RcnA